MYCMQKNSRILILDPVHPLIPEELSAHGFICDCFPGCDRVKVLSIIGEYAGVIVRSRTRLDREILAGAGQLKFIGRVGSGMENIDVGSAERAGIVCINSPEGNRDAVGEHALGMILALLNHIPRADREVRNGRWIREANRGTEIKGKTVAIIGYGNTGSAFAQRLKGFDARVISYDKYKQGYTDGNTRETDPEEIFYEADILSLHVPLTEETTFLVDREFLGRFRKEIWLINTSRGKIVKTADLVEAMKTGKVIGAALDVLEYEESSFESLSGGFPEDLKYLTGSDRVILSPHIAGWTRESEIKLATVLVRKIIEFFQ